MSHIARKRAAWAAVSRHGWCNFPVRQIAGSPRVVGAVARTIWVVIPLQYYILTTINQGFAAGGYLATAAVAITSVVAIVIVAGLASLLWFWRGRLADRIHSVAIALLAVWGGAVALVALSYFVTGTEASHEPYDVIFRLVADRWPPTGENRDISVQTFSAYSLYCLAAATGISLLIRGVSGLAGRREQKDARATDAGEGDRRTIAALPEPNVVIIALISGALMMVLYRVSIVGSWSELLDIFSP